MKKEHFENNQLALNKTALFQQLLTPLSSHFLTLNASDKKGRLKKNVNISTVPLPR